MNNIDNLKDRLISFGWITGLLLLVSLLWILTQPLQVHYLLRTVNSALIAADDSRRVISYAGHNGKKAGPLGYWYSMYVSADKMFVFAVFQDGILIPLGAVVSPAGKVNDIIPLSAHAKQVIDSLPDSVLQMYVTRIEAAFIADAQGAAR